MRPSRSPLIPSRAARRSSPTWTATSAAAAPITASPPPSSALRRRAEMELTRREFLKASGGLTFGFAFSLPAEAKTGFAPNAWVKIGYDGTVTILSTGAEMGQGSMTSLPLILAEEMDADWSKVKIEFAPADADIYGYTFNNSKAMAIVGSRAVMLYYDQLRIAGAQVRKVLLANAAQRWNSN